MIVCVVVPGSHIRQLYQRNGVSEGNIQYHHIVYKCQKEYGREVAHRANPKCHPLLSASSLPCKASKQPNVKFPCRIATT